MPAAPVAGDVFTVSWSCANNPFLIVGSADADGAYDGTPGVRIQMSGDAWTLELEWNDNAGSVWQPSDVRKTAEYTISNGLSVTLGADDNFDAVRDHEHNEWCWPAGRWTQRSTLPQTTLP